MALNPNQATAYEVGATRLSESVGCAALTGAGTETSATADAVEAALSAAIPVARPGETTAAAAAFASSI